MAKNIVICCDGTANQYGHNNTNVVKLYERVEINDNQLNFYDPGVGTSSRSWLMLFRFISNKLSQGLGLDLHRNVEDAYLYLMNHYEEGDQIFLFGFSRGAHTVRRLAAVLGKCGLLYRGSDNMAPYVLRMYDGDEDQEIINNFRKTYTIKCPVYFLGVWDTVSAVTRLIPRSKLDGVLSGEIQYAYHAVSIDERRLQFPPNLFDPKTIQSHQTVEEVWFAGVHSDVGGYYKESGLSDIALKWMMEKAIKAGLKECTGALETIAPNPNDKIHKSWTGFFWFVPWHMYGVLAIVLTFLAQVAISYSDLFWDFPYRPLNELYYFLCDNWSAVIVLILIMIPFTQKKRQIPKKSKIHKSVQARISSGQYKPSNLLPLIEKNEIEWVH